MLSISSAGPTLGLDPRPTLGLLTRLPVMDVFAQNNITLSGQLEPGKYVFKAVLNDKLSDKTAAKTAEFEIE